MNKPDLPLNNLQGLICHKTKPAHVNGVGRRIHVEKKTGRERQKLYSLLSKVGKNPVSFTIYS